MDVMVIFGQMLVLFSMMLIGFFVYKKGWIDDDASGRLSKLVVNVFNPILVVNGVLDGQNSTDSGRGILENVVMGILYFVILIIVSYLIVLVLRPQKGTRNMYRLMTIFSNVGFMGIPVIRSIYGNGAMIYVAIYILIYNLMIYTLGFSLARKAAAEYTGEEGSTTGSILMTLKKLINPGVIAALLAVIIFVSGISLPSPIHTFCDYMGNTTIPLSMLLIGISVAQEEVRKMLGDIRIYLFIILRMVLLPIAMIFLLRGLGIDEVVFGVFIIELGMPVGSIIALIVRECGADSAYCTKGVVLSTLASIVTIPVICMFL